MDERPPEPCVRRCLRCRKPFRSPDRTTRFLCDPCNQHNAAVRSTRTYRFPAVEGLQPPPERFD